MLIERADPGPGRRAAEAARHLRLAGRDDQAVAQLARAAEHARAVGAIDEAAGFLAEALELRPDDTELLLAASDAEAWRGHRALAEERFEQALKLVEAEGDPLACATAWLHLERGYHGPICYPRGVLHTSTRVLEILDEAGLDAPALRLEALSARAWSEAIAGDADEAERLLAQVLDLAGGELDDGLLRFDVSHARQLALIRRGQFREAYGPSIEAGVDAVRAGRPDLSAGIWINAAAAAMAVGEHARAEEFIDRALEALDGVGTFALELLTWSARAHLYLRTGRLDAARDAAAHAEELADRLGSPEYARLTACDSGLVALARGEHERAADLLARALDGEAPISRPLARLARAEALAALHRCDEADAEIRATALEPVGPADFPDTLVARLTRVQGLVAAARGDDALAQRRLRESAAGWKRITDRGRGDRMHAVFADFGRPAIGLVEPPASSSASKPSWRSSMPQFSDAITTSAPPEEVWKLLYDASRFAEWWEGIETSEVRDGGATIYPDGYPDFPMPQAIEASRDGGGRVRISCLVSDIRFEWRLAEHAGGTRISVDVEVPEEEAQRFDRQREVAQKSLKNLAERARA